mgnify:CR=1 FL=1
MARLGENIIGTSEKPPFFKVANQNALNIEAPQNRKGDALRTWVRSLSGFQKEALICSAKTGDTWRLVSDEGPYLNGHDAAPCPLAFLSTGMVASFSRALTEGLSTHQTNDEFDSMLNSSIESIYQASIT